ncbi:type II toxin-antitoxin system RelE/ParE family toxin [Longimicrobium sp.]|uniref:type II toxin-antitoxin system RelE/ParE family toxin n=1 Tax=Longimicrobium sp. TaxID=2029185 RepID=UPI003B3A846F
MAYEVEFTDEFDGWWDMLEEDEQESVRAGVEKLISFGPFLEFPDSSGIRGSRHGRMRELRVKHRGRPYRVLYAFDPRRVAILLIGGDKTGSRRWYERFVPLADDLYDQHLREIAEEGEWFGAERR